MHVYTISNDMASSINHLIRVTQKKNKYLLNTMCYKWTCERMIVVYYKLIIFVCISWNHANNLILLIHTLP